MKVRNNVWLLPIFLCTILKGGSAIRGEPLSSQAQTKSRNLKKKGSKSGLFGAVLNDVETKKERNEKKDEEYEIFAASLNVTSDIPANLTGTFNSIALDREIPVFSLRFIITATNKVPIQDGGNLNELEIVTEEYLDRRFHEVFKNTPANYQYTAVQLKTTTDPFILDVYATSTFQIPGEVPTYVYLTEQVKKAFKVPLDVNQYETNFEYYTKELSLMSDTNPFYKTDDLAFIQRDNDWMIKDTNPKGTKQSLSDALSDKNHVIVPILGILGFLVLVAVGLLWIKGKENGVQVYENELTLDTKPEKNDERDGDAICSTPSYGKDEETARYLASVREELSKSNDLEDVKISDATVRIGELTEKPEPLGSYISPNYCDEVSCDEVEMECQFDEEYEKEYEEEYEEEEIEEDVGISINLKEDPPPASNVEIV